MLPSSPAQRVVEDSLQPCARRRGSGVAVIRGIKDHWMGQLDDETHVLPLTQME
jgi:hypothetical protein